MYGIHACKAALNNEKRNIHKICILEKHIEIIPSKYKKIVQVMKNPKDLDSFVQKDCVHQGIIIQVDSLNNSVYLQNIKDNEKSRYLILDGVDDVHNIGASLRCAAAFGASGVIVQNVKNIEENGILAKIASGALEVVPLILVVNISKTIEELKKLGYWVIGFDEQGEFLKNQISTFENVALVFGSEGKGIRPLIKKNCDLILKYKTDGFSTLNLSTACSIALHEHFR